MGGSRCHVPSVGEWASLVVDGSSRSCGENFIQMAEHVGPCLVVPVSRLLVREACMREPQMRSVPACCEFDGYDGLSSLGSVGSQPRHLHYPIGLETEEAPVMRMALALVTCFEEEGRVDLGG